MVTIRGPYRGATRLRGSLGRLASGIGNRDCDEAGPAWRVPGTAWRRNSGLPQICERNRGGDDPAGVQARRGRMLRGRMEGMVRQIFG